jgi:rhodanese-related sulfurtransferase
VIGRGRGLGRECRTTRATTARLYDLPVAGFETVDAADWESWVEGNQAMILDVREAEEWALGTLPGSVLISMSEMIDRLDELPRDRPILCVCRSGNRSHHVARYLSLVGFPTVANMAGGLKALGLQD